MAEETVKKASWSIVFVIIGVIIAIALIYYGIEQYQTMSANPDKDWSQSGIPEGYRWLRYIFGPLGTFGGIGEFSQVIMIVAMWLLIFVTFSDIIAMFSTFSKPIAWIVGFCMALIAAQVGWIFKMLVLFAGGFLGLGAIGVFAGLLGSFLAFAFVNLGLTQFSGWLRGRRIMMQAEEEGYKIKAGGKKIGDLYRSQKEMADALEE